MRNFVQRILHVTFGTRTQPKVIERGPLNPTAGQKPPGSGTTNPITTPIDPSRILN